MTRSPIARLALAVTLALPLAAALGACTHTSEADDDAQTGTTVESDGERAGITEHDADDVAITGNKLVQAQALTGQDVQVMGNANEATFTGPCGEASIIGADNRVSLENVTTISVVGNHNIVTWRGPKPTISNAGEDNQISQAK